ncbi:hypothetical protein LCGC14_2135520, partial [marine sediment metagenome]
GHMWGCWVVWNGDGKEWDEQWMWDTTAKDRKRGFRYKPVVFTETREEIMPLVRYVRAEYTVKSAKAVKVPIPEPPDA